MTSDEGDRADPRVLERLRAGDPAALDQLLAAYWQPLLRYGVRLIREPDVAEDLVQEAFVRLWLRRDRLEAGSLRSFLYRVLHNLAMDELRRRQSRQRSLLELANEEPSFPAASHEPPAGVDSAVTQAIDSLPARRREAFILAYQHRLTYREIAEVMEVSPATVKNQVAAALAQLRETLRGALAAFRQPE